MILCGKEAEAIGKLEKKRGVRMIENGRVAERFNVPDSKSGVGVTLPWVQIPPRPSLLIYDLVSVRVDVEKTANKDKKINKI